MSILCDLVKCPKRVALDPFGEIVERGWTNPLPVALEQNKLFGKHSPRTQPDAYVSTLGHFSIIGRIDSTSLPSGTLSKQGVFANRF